MGTRFELVLPAADGGPQGRALRAAGEAAIDEIDYWHRRLNRFAPDSLVSHLNRSAGEPTRLDQETFDLFTDALDVSRASAGAFDVTIASLLVSRGAADSAVPTGGRVLAGTVELDRAAQTIRVTGGSASIDLGAIAKGHALDCAIAVLRSAGVRTALLHGGTSSVAAIGRPDERSHWRVAVGQGAGVVITLLDAALSLSDPDGQTDVTGRRHIVDPRSSGGEQPAPETTRRTQVVVIGPSARLADAWSTALAVLGRVPAAFPDGYEARFVTHLDGATTHALAAS